jgi:hypothetical protein
MSSPATRRCDGCAQAASDEHTGKRLRRLEWATRFRPVHIKVLFLGGVVPRAETDFLYAGAGDEEASGWPGTFRGEGKQILLATGLGAMLERISVNRSEVLAEFQHRGYFLTHVLECPLESTADKGATLTELIASQLPVAMTRIRRSLKPRRVVVISQALNAIMPQIMQGALGAEILLDGEKAFALDGENEAAVDAAVRLERVVAVAEGSR